jgi:putative intracellular protease/amidase
VEYSREVQARVAEEFLLLPDGFAVVEMMGDYAVLREQARVCARMYAR